MAAGFKAPRTIYRKWAHHSQGEFCILYSMSQDAMISRKDVLKGLVLGLGGLAVPSLGLAAWQNPAPASSSAITLDDLKSFAKIAGLKMTDEELNQVLDEVRQAPAGYAMLRTQPPANGLQPSSVFRVPGVSPDPRPRISVRVSSGPMLSNPSDEDLAFATVAELGALLRAKEVTSVQLTRLALNRMKRWGEPLKCVVALLEERALQQAERLDAESRAGKWRGPLHGIPYGLKDLFSARGAPTQWGTAAFQGQIIDQDAAVVEKLEAAGAILVAKVSLGALAMNDNWFGGRTKNPWNPTQGSSGSSAGSACSVAAGLVPFAIGTETSGSIVSPSHRCRVVGFRPTFGSVSRHGAMALSWSMDKVGPICRSAEDPALVLAALLGADPRDPGSVSRSFVYAPRKDLKGQKWGLLGRPDPKAQSLLEAAGVQFQPWTAPPLNPALGAIIACEAAAVFDEITRNGRLSLVTENEWPQIFRAARFVPAVEYLQLERARTLLIQAYSKAFEGLDGVLAPDHAVATIYPMNLAGFPQLLLPWGANDRGTEQSVSLLGSPLSEPNLIAAGALLQRSTDFHRRRPDLTKI